MGEAADQVDGELHQQRTVLLVEDDPLVRISTSDYLRAKGYHVIEAGTAIEAATVLSSGPPVHALFSDVDLPGAMGGLSLAVWVHTHHPAIPVILTSGVRAVMPALSRQRRIPFLPKPYDVEKVAALIARVITEASSPKDDKSVEG
jgi:two-component system, response regulator PdtaR